MISMNDHELAEFLNVDVEDVRKIIKTEDERAVYDKMAQFCIDEKLWAAGLGPRPTGGIICGLGR